MIIDDRPLLVGEALAASILLRAAAAKLVVPTTAAAAVGELLRRPMATRFIRCVAITELITVLLFAVPPLLGLAQVLVGLLGAMFVGVGLAGLLRHTTRPCGCFGAESKRPLGSLSIASGMFLVVVSTLVLYATPAHYSTNAPAALTALVSMGWLLTTHRSSFRTVVANAKLGRLRTSQ